MAVSAELADFAARIFNANREDLALIAKAVNTRRKFLDEMDVHQAEGNTYVGDRVTISRCSTQYLNGCHGTVKRITDTGVTVEITDITGSSSRVKAERKLFEEVTFPFICIAGTE